jgi:protein SCO1/2
MLSTLRTLLVLTLLLLAGLAATFIYKPQSVPKLGSLGGNFTLQSHQGDVSLTDFKGKVVAIYIGYASCPDVCPTALAVMTQAFKTLSEDELQKVQGIFISVDPERDTPEKLQAYANFFSPLIIGVTGTQAEIDQVVKQYGAFYRKVVLADSAMGYAVDHSSRIYLIDQEGVLNKTLLHNSTPNELLTDIRTLLSTQ